MTEPILSHTFPNGLVLVAEPMRLAAIGGVHVPRAGRLRLRSAGAQRAGQLHLRDDASRGGPRATAGSSSSTWTTSASSGAKSVSDAHASYSGATRGREPAGRAGHLRRPAPPAPPARRTVGGVPAGGLAGPAGRRGRAGREGDDRASPPPLSQPWGRPRQASSRRSKRSRSTTSARFFRRHFRPNGTILGVAGRIDWEPLRGPGRPPAGRLGSRSRRADRRASRPPGGTATSPTTRPDADRHRLRQRAVPASGLLPGMGGGGRARAAA